MKEKNLLDKNLLLEQAAALMAKSKYSHEDNARCERLLQLASVLGEKRINPTLPREEFHAFLRDISVQESARISEIGGAVARMGGYGSTGTHSLLRSMSKSGTGLYLCPEGFRPALLECLAMHDQLFDSNVCTIWETRDGNAARLPILDDTANIAVEVSESSATSPGTQDPVSPGLALPAAVSYRTSPVRVSVELEQDSAWNALEFLTRAFAARFARGIGPVLVAELMGSAMLGRTCTGDLIAEGADATNSVGYQDLIELRKSVDPAYRSAEKVFWLMNDNTLAHVDSRLDESGHPLITPQYDAVGNRLLLGYKVAICPSMDDIGAGAKPIAFGSTGHFITRIAKQIHIQPYGERWAEYGQIGFEGFMRCNGALGGVTDTDAPVKYLQNNSGA